MACGYKPRGFRAHRRPVAELCGLAARARTIGRKPGCRDRHAARYPFLLGRCGRETVIRFLKEEWLSLAIVLALALGMQAIEYYGWLAGPEGKLMDRLLSAESGMAAESPILLVEIDDEAYSKCFQETSPMNPQAVAGLVAGIASDPKPWVVGVD